MTTNQLLLIVLRYHPALCLQADLSACCTLATQSAGDPRDGGASVEDQTAVGSPDAMVAAATAAASPLKYVSDTLACVLLLVVMLGL